MNKMNIYKLALTALLIGSSVGFYSCKNEEDDIFDASAAQRLDTYKKEYSADLTSNGGKWLMEYFPSDEERGYVFVMTFSTDGSVVVSGQNVWLGNQFTSDVSLWSVIADNGPVLTFNTYNKVLHEFSTPEDITGDYQPTDPDTGAEIDEQGTGHGGDYEFVIIGLSDDGNSMHLTGKKTLHDIYMYRLDASTDEETLLAEYVYATNNTIQAIFPDLILTDTQSGEQFAVSGGDDGIFDFWPLAGDPVTQTVSMNALVGPSSIRMRKPLAIERANEVDSIVVETFVRQNDGTYLCTDNGQNLVLDNCGYGNIFTGLTSWSMSPSDCGGKFADVANAIATEIRSTLRVTFRGFNWIYSSSDRSYALQTVVSSGASAAYIYGTQEVTDDGNSVKLTVSTSEGNTNGRNFLNRIASITDFIELINATDFVIESENRFAPRSMKFVDVNDPSNYFVFTK